MIDPGFALGVKLAKVTPGSVPNCNTESVLLANSWPFDSEKMTPVVQPLVAWPSPPKYTLLCRFDTDPLKLMLSRKRLLVSLVAVDVIDGASEDAEAVSTDVLGVNVSGSVDIEHVLKEVKVSYVCQLVSSARGKT